MSTAMDMFLSATDSLPFPDILDIDIKSEIDTLVGGHNDFSGFNFSEIQPLELEDVHEIKWFNSNSNHSNLDFSGEEGPTMVNPNAVMPVVSLGGNVRSPSPSLKESHLTFSPATIKISSLKAIESTPVNTVKKDLLNKLEEARIVPEKPIFKRITKVTPILSKPQIKTIARTANPTIVFRNAIERSVSSPIHISQVNNITTVRTVAPTPNFATRKLALSTNRVLDEEGQRAFPKPAYSYSCLIAMALKNSKTGSLPVSEIYNFMCTHFPYFKTAPNGWKNSVRHNLSLNKCFEKIEKPAVNGAQRKGCLWAMNPAKISKMDEEVQKWSRKDPLAIKNAMINPEQLESLEKGELKFSCSSDDDMDNFGDSCGSAAESEEGTDESESEQEVEQEIEVDTLNAQYEYINVKEEEIDVEVSNVYDVEEMEDVESDKELLRMEMALAQKELLEYESTMNNKRRRTYIIQQH